MKRSDGDQYRSIQVVTLFRLWAAFLKDRLRHPENIERAQLIVSTFRDARFLRCRVDRDASHFDVERVTVDRTSEVWTARVRIGFAIRLDRDTVSLESLPGRCFAQSRFGIVFEEPFPIGEMALLELSEPCSMPISGRSKEGSVERTQVQPQKKDAPLSRLLGLERNAACSWVSLYE